MARPRRPVSPRLLPPLLAGMAAAVGCGPAPGDADAQASAPPGASGGLAVLHDAVEPVPGERPMRPGLHDFGNVTDGEVVHHAFRLENQAEVPVAVTEIRPSCGCTVPSMWYEDPAGERVRSDPAAPRGEPLIVVPPGTEATLEVQVDTRSLHQKNVDKLLTVMVTTDHEASPYLRFEAHLIVDSPFQVVPREISLGRFARSAGGRDTTDVVPISPEPWRVSGILEQTAGTTAELREIDRTGRPVWVLEAGFEGPVGEGHHAGEITLGTVRPDGAAGPPITVSVTGLAVPDLQTDPGRLVVVADRGSPGPFRGEVRVHSLLDGHRLRILQAEVPDEHAERLAASFAPEEPDAKGRSRRWRLSLETLAPIQEDVLSGSILLALDDSQTPSLEVRYVVHAR